MRQPPSVFVARVCWFAASEPGVRLGQPEAAEPLARAELRQVLLLLLLGAPAQDRASRPARSAPRSPCASPSVAADLLDDDAVGEVVEAGAAVLARHDRAEVPLVGDLADELEVEVAGCGRCRGRAARLPCRRTSRAVSRMSFCSSVRSKSMRRNLPRERVARTAIARTQLDAFCPRWTPSRSSCSSLDLSCSCSRLLPPGRRPRRDRLEADALARARGPARGRRHRADARGDQNARRRKRGERSSPRTTSRCGCAEDLPGGEAPRGPSRPTQERSRRRSRRATRAPAASGGGAAR